MKIAVDLDGVVYEWERTARYMLREYKGSMALFQPSEGWDWIKERVSEDNWEWLWTDGIDLGLFRYGHCVRGSIIGLKELHADGHKLLAVTHRPSAAVPDTLAWLAYINIPWNAVHILSNGEPKSTVDAELLIDDKPANVQEWRKAGREAILFDQPWNQKAPRVPKQFRAHGWEEVPSVIREYL